MKDRLQQLTNIEADVVKVIETAGLSILELSKEEPSAEAIAKQSTDFLAKLEGVERALNENISYLSQVSTSRSHEGSGYSIEKNFQLNQAATTEVARQLEDIHTACLKE